MTTKEIIEQMRDMDRQIIDGKKPTIFGETADLLENWNRAALELLTIWDRQYGRISESMGRDNPRLEALESKMERLRTENSKLSLR